MNLEEIERAKYERVWQDPRYRHYAPGEKYMRRAFEALGMNAGETLIDYGCGTGRATAWFAEQGLEVLGVDHVENCLEADIPFRRACLWDLPDIVADWAYCTDVMEHIPEEKVEAVLAGIRERTKNGAFFSIATRPDGFGPRILGEPLHMTIKRAEWWGMAVSAHFKSVEMTTGAYGLYVCKA